MKTNYIIGAVVGSLVGLGLAEAKPTKWDNCDSVLNIQHPVNSAGLRYSADCKVAYVLPPTTGSITKISSAGVYVNSTVCQSLDSLNQTTAIQADTLRSINNSLNIRHRANEDYEKRITEIRADRTKLRNEARGFRAELKIRQGEAASLNQKIQELQAELEKTRSETQKYLIRQNISKLRTQLQPFEKEIIRLESSIQSREQQIAEESTEESDLMSYISNNQQRMGADQAPIIEAQKQTEERYKQHTASVGAILNFSYDVGHMKLVNEYKKLNPSISFTDMPVRFSKIHATVNLTPDTDDLYKLTLDATNSAGATYDNGMFGSAAPSGTLQMTLNRVAACSLLDSKTGELSEEKVKNAKLLNMQNMYQYELSGKHGYYVKYNVAELYERIRQSGSRGGFFKKRSWSTVIENSEFDALFTIDFTSDDSQVEIPPEERERIRQEEKAIAVDTLFKDFLTMAAQDGALPLPQIGMPEQNGAQAGAQALAKCPHLYCQVGSALLGVADSIWGSTKATSHYKNTKKFEYEKKYNVQRMHLEKGSTGYEYTN